jgi:hypothetical protein
VIAQTAAIRDTDRSKIHAAAHTDRHGSPAEDPSAQSENRALVGDASLVRLARAAVRNHY